MGNACKRLAYCCVEPCVEPSDWEPGHSGGGNSYRPSPHGRNSYQEEPARRPIGPNAPGIPVQRTTNGFAAFARDVFEFETTGLVSRGLSRYVQAGQHTQAVWYQRVLVAWRTTPPKNAAEASNLVLQALQGELSTDVLGLLSFYQLPQPQVPPGGPPPPAPPKPQVAIGSGKLPDGVQYELRTLPVKRRDVGDGDGMTVYVEVLKNPRETSIVPRAVQEALHQRRTALLNRDFATADSLKTKIEDVDYKILEIKRNQEILVHKYVVRLRGVDAPEIGQPYGRQAQAVLLNLVEGHSLRLLVYLDDYFGRKIADVYCNNVFIQEVLLKRGCAWHFVKYDQSPQFAKWEKEAQAARVGLWDDPNPENPLDYKRKHPRRKSAPRFRSPH
ncbi:unnamed protein product [Sphagnum jensenii]|uniref:TNase-like domain-containing protein n=1 Tax=Sphagnum jensenii TaxID=128206 RepID=A0ABP1BEI1_9BRYO